MKKKIISFIEQRIKMIIFFALTIFTFASIFLIMKYYRHEWIKNVGYSIVAAYIFYLLNECTFNIINYFSRKKKRNIIKAIAYRKLQLLLCRLDDIFISIYEAKNKQKYKGTLNELYQVDVLRRLTSNFCLLDKSDILCEEHNGSCRHLTYEEKLFSLWNDVKRYADELLNTQYIYFDYDLSYQIQYLVNDNFISTFFQKIYCFDKTHSLCLFIPKGNREVIEDAFNNIIKLHKIAFELYDCLKEDHRFKNIYKPIFYDKDND